MSADVDPQAREAAELLACVARVMGEQGVTQSDLARRSGFTRSFISHLLAGRREATLATALLLAHRLGLLTMQEFDDR